MRLWLEAGTGPLDILSRIREGRSTEYDIIHTFDHFLNVAIPFYYLRKKTKSKFVSDWCDLYHLAGGLREIHGFKLDFIYDKIGFPFRMYNRFVESDLRRKADFVVVISNKLREIALQNGIENEKLAVIEGGVDVDLVKPLPAIEMRKKLGLPVDAHIIGFIGRHQEDLDIVIESFVLLKNELSNCFLLIVGEPNKRTKKLAGRAGIIDNYIEIGRCSDDLLPQYLACADIFVMPYKNNLSNEARWANKFGEYLAAGRPMIISNVGDQAEIVEKYELGLVADTTVEDFACKMKKLLTNQKLNHKFGENARKVACNYYSWGRMAEKLETLYFKVYDQK
jgi:glycosyltransferase involved in cell wall biosynthesis